MGIDITALRALAFVKRVGIVDFSQVVTLGRQEVFFTEQEFNLVMKRSGLDLPYSADYRFSAFQEPLVEALGAEGVASVDASPYEGASLIHDFNKALSAQHHGRYSLYIDFGSMEHIFNVPQVIANINSLLKVGGHALITTNVDGDGGHGFYQFSPEFFYSAFSEDNGFADTQVFLVNTKRPRHWHRVARPDDIKSRNAIPSGRRLLAVVLTRKISSVAAMSAQQSDYSSQSWTQVAHSHTTTMSRGRLVIRRAFAHVPLLLISLRAARSHLKQRRRFALQSTRFDPERASSQGASG